MSLYMREGGAGNTRKKRRPGASRTERALVAEQSHLIPQNAHAGYAVEGDLQKRSGHGDAGHSWSKRHFQLQEDEGRLVFWDKKEMLSRSAGNSLMTTGFSSRIGGSATMVQRKKRGGAAGKPGGKSPGGKSPGKKKGSSPGAKSKNAANNKKTGGTRGGTPGKGKSPGKGKGGSGRGGGGRGWSTGD